MGGLFLLHWNGFHGSGMLNRPRKKNGDLLGLELESIGMSLMKIFLSELFLVECERVQV
jgi:hypothetical protein